MILVKPNMSLSFITTAILVLYGSYALGQEIHDKFTTKPILISINSIDNDSIISIQDEFGNVVKSSDYLFDKSLGYPLIQCEYGYLSVSGFINRFLAKYGNTYGIVDSSLNIIIPFADTIIPIWSNHIPEEESNACYSTKIKMYYQTISSDSTKVYDNYGQVYMANKFKGIVVQDYFYQIMSDYERSTPNRDFLIIRNDESNRYGLIDKNGSSILPLMYADITPWDYTISESTFRLSCIDSVSKNSDLRSCAMFDAERNLMIIEADNIAGEHLYYMEQVFYKDSKAGIFHPEFGILEEAIYDEIIRVDKKVYLIKGEKRKVWKPSLKVKKYYRNYLAKTRE